MGRLKITAAIVAAFVTGSAFNIGASAASYGFCSQPMAPSAYFSKPSKPYCYTARNCSSWQISSYQSEIDRYYANLKRYAQQVDSYYEDASRYIKCMSYLD